uniref:Uncharacterized protein n=1 Tax=Anguilla anguilla TaxID=7936 RepID=A0A0E9UPN5_ANGAN
MWPPGPSAIHHWHILFESNHLSFCCSC